MDSVEEAAKNIVNVLKLMYQAPLTIVDASEEEFGHLDLNQYRDFKAEMCEKGYRYLGDIEILEVSNSPDTILARTMVRLMLSDDGYTYIGYYQLKPRIWRLSRMLLKGLWNLRFIAAPTFFLSNLNTKNCYELESEFSDGTFVTTSNAKTAGLFEQPSSIDSIYYDFDIELSVLIKDHRKRFYEKIESVSVTPVKIMNRSDLFGMQERLKALKDAHRETLRWVSQNELLSMSGGNKKQSEEVFSEVQKLLQKGLD